MHFYIYNENNEQLFNNILIDIYYMKLFNKNN